MNPEENQEVVVAPEANEGEGEPQTDVVTLKKEEYEKLNQTLGSLKRELKDLRKPKEESKETPTTNANPDELNSLKESLNQLKMQTAGLTHPDDQKLAQDTAKKWKVDISEVLADEDFKTKLERQQTTRTNVEATSGIKGGAGAGSAKNTAEYWMSKGTPPTPTDVPDRKTRQAIVRKMLTASQKTTGGFYNE